jgi:hypothetical protein
VLQTIGCSSAKRRPESQICRSCPKDTQARDRRRLRKETTMGLKWIAQHLQMGSWTYVSNLQYGASPAIQQIQQQLRLYQ